MKRSLLSSAGVADLGSAAVGTEATNVCKTRGTLTETAGAVLVRKARNVAGKAKDLAGSALKVADKLSVRWPGRAVADRGTHRVVNAPRFTTVPRRVPGCGVAGVAACGSGGGTITLPVSL